MISCVKWPLPLTSDPFVAWRAVSDALLSEMQMVLKGGLPYTGAQAPAANPSVFPSRNTTAWDYMAWVSEGLPIPKPARPLRLFLEDLFRVPQSRSRPSLTTLSVNAVLHHYSFKCLKAPSFFLKAGLRTNGRKCDGRTAATGCDEGDWGCRAAVSLQLANPISTFQK